MSIKILVGLLAAVLVTGAGVVATYGNPFATDTGPSPCSLKASAEMPCNEGGSCCVLTGAPSCCDSEEVAETNDATLALTGGVFAADCEQFETVAE